MKKTAKVLAIVLSLVMILALAVPAAAYDYAANAKIVRSDYTGKRVFLGGKEI